MKNMKRSYAGLPAALLAAALCCPPAPLSAADASAGAYGAVFMKIPTGSPRAQALGNSGAALVEGAEALNINPAGIATSQLREFSFSYLSWFGGYGGQYLAYVHPIGQSVIGLNVAYYSIEDFDVRDSAGIRQHSADVKVNNAYATLALAKSFFLERFSLGASVKSVLEDNHSASYRNYVFDLGASLRLGRKLSLGWSGQNYSGSEKEVVQIQRLGAVFSPNPFFTFVVENKKYSDRGAASLGGGVEFSLPEELLQVGKVSFRAGYTGTSDFGKSYDESLDRFGLTEASGWSFGVGIYTAQSLGYGIGVDYALVPYGALGKSNQLSVKMQF
ncbi:MAG: hypothetical protein FD189_357 [Elusimicrobia bacterium]|nr:MAG: hypothetical protein FD154_437 [Elusimicrobiota bacterium]KAF0157836.1 MAG: hypothetical protein FD189_357 [Elusimicrobiota bacterium]